MLKGIGRKLAALGALIKALAFFLGLGAILVSRLGTRTAA